MLNKQAFLGYFLVNLCPPSSQTGLTLTGKQANRAGRLKPVFGRVQHLKNSALLLFAHFMDNQGCQIYGNVIC